MLAIKTILHPTDFSEPASHARKMALEMARDYGARLILLHVVEPPVYYGELGANVNPSDDVRQTEREKLAELVEPDSNVRIEPITVDGMAALEILRVARERHADLIVVGSHGRSGLGRVLMGSVAEEISRNAPCPVLIVRTSPEVSQVALTTANPGVTMEGNKS